MGLRLQRAVSPSGRTKATSSTPPVSPLGGCRAAAAALALFALVGCASNERVPQVEEAAPTREVEQPAATPVAPQPVLDDATITAKVRAKLAASAELNPFDLEIGTAEGVVSLSGRVDTEREKAEAERIARETSGVRAVRNLLAVAAS